MKSRNIFLWFCFFMLTATTILLFLPGHNGDLPFYIASAIEKPKLSYGELVSRTVSVLHAELPVEEAEMHIKRIQEASPAMMDFYRIKPLYTFMIAAFHALGFSFVFSTVLPSLLSYFFIGLLCFRWAAREMPPLNAMILSAVLMLISPSMIIARLSTPDGLSNLCFLAIFYLFFFQERKTLLLCLLLISILIRLDNILGVLVMLTAMQFGPAANAGNRMSYKAYFFFMGAAILIAFLINHIFVQDPWWFRNEASYGSVTDYKRSALIYLFSIPQSYFMAMVLIFVLLGLYRRFRLSDPACFFLAMLAVLFISRFLFFLHMEERFFTAVYIAGFLVIDSKIKWGQNGDLSIRS